LIWARLERLNEDHKLGWKMYENEGLIEAPRGGKFRVFGFDKLPELQKTRGYKIRLAIFDEPATYADKLELLIRECVGPALSDLRGTLIINGTPGSVCAGFWYECSTGVRKRYTTFHWSVLDNPKFPRDAREMLREEMQENGWTEEDATYQREWMARWVNDPEAQVYKFTIDRNLIKELPADYVEQGGGWMFTLGVDFGYSPDPCAWAVLGSPRNSKVTYVVHEEQHLELLPDEAAAVTARLVERFDPGKVVGDPAAAEYIAEWNRRWSDQSKSWMHPAKKLGKKDAIEVTNGELRASRFLVYGPGCPNLPHEAQHLPWKNEKRDEEHPSYPNHSCDAGFLYAAREHRAYLNEVPPPKPDADQAALLEQQRRIDAVQSAIRAREAQEDDY
jgi:hypothetical protein